MEKVSKTMRSLMRKSAEKNGLTLQPNGSYRGVFICQDCNKDFEVTVETPLGFHHPENCPDCSSIKANEITADEKASLARLVAEIARRKEEIIKECIPRKYWLLDTDRIEALDKYWEQSVYLYGNHGAGKSVWAASAAKRLIRAGGSAMWISMAEYIMRLQASFKDPEANVYELAKRAADFQGLLVIDDLGAEKLTEYVEQVIYYLLNHREEYCLQTIITGNFSVVEQGRRVNQRISSRLSAMKLIEFTGDDRRPQK